MKQEKDSRINTASWSVKDYLLLFLTQMVVIGTHMYIYIAMDSSGLTDPQFMINVLIGYLLVMSMLLTGTVGLVRNTSWSRPMRRVGEAARKIARGDFSVRIAPLRKDGKKDFAEVMFDDFNIMAEELESIETLKSDFIANVSHEIKTPLSVIQGYAAALQSDALPVDERREYAKTIVEASHKLSTLVSNILKLNKLENQEIIPACRPYDLGEQLRRCALAFEELWECKNITFTADLDEIPVLNNEDMLEIVWNNLLSNAIKFTGPGGRISLSLKARGGFALAVVQDSGCGMDGETKKRIFDKFYQGDTSHSREGNGLGLALVKKVIEMQGGSITVESAMGQGSMYTVSLKI
jgi:signal transduction histidine kinase